MNVHKIKPSPGTRTQHFLVSGKVWFCVHFFGHCLYEEAKWHTWFNGQQVENVPVSTWNSNKKPVDRQTNCYFLTNYWPPLGSERAIVQGTTIMYKQISCSFDFGSWFLPPLQNHSYQEHLFLEIHKNMWCSVMFTVKLTKQLWVSCPAQRQFKIRTCTLLSLYSLNGWNIWWMAKIWQLVCVVSYYYLLPTGAFNRI